jgi:hypothetical protein
MRIRKKAVFLLAGTVVVLGMCAGLWTGWRFFSYIRAHGGGMPTKTEDGEYALNDHGRVTVVPREVYTEARKRWWLFMACIVLALAALGVFLILAQWGRFWITWTGGNKCRRI